MPLLSSIVVAFFVSARFANYGRADVLLIDPEKKAFSNTITKKLVI